MQVDELDYELPDELIARYPAEERCAGRLLVVERSRQRWQDRKFLELPDLLRPNDVLVLNNTRVLPAKFRINRASGGSIEGLWTGSTDDGSWNVLLRGAARLKIGEILHFDRAVQRYEVVVLSKGSRGQYVLKVSPDSNPGTVLQEVGLTPLPPYIKRRDQRNEHIDRSRYQTIYAKSEGAIAAPTAGLHFDKASLERVVERGIEVVEITLHVGLGTFEPITADRLEDHHMHSECYEAQPDVWETIARAKNSGRRVVAVGTTTTRALETIAGGGRLHGRTDIFIYPPRNFAVADALLTNFHLPRSTLLAMIYAFGGTDLISRAYKHAIEQRYRFYSYGDAMLIE